MATATAHRTDAPVGRAGFGRLVGAEWTKFRSVGRWVLGILASVALTVLISLVAAGASATDANRSPDLVVGPAGGPVVDDFHFVHQPLAGDGTITARVVSQQDSHEWARAGVIIKESLASGSRYAAVMVTPDHGVRLQANYRTDLAGGDAAAPRWLRLVRAGAAVTGYESADGTSWHRVGTVHLGDLPPTVRVGLFVASPPEVRIERQAGSTSMGEISTTGTAVFDQVRLEAAAAGAPRRWENGDIGRPAGGSATESGGSFTVTGSGDIADKPPPDDPVQISLFGIIVGLMAIIAVSVLSITSEFRRGMIRTTFTASPGRGRVLLAKALVIGGVAFAAGLVGSVMAYLATQPSLVANGFGPPAFPPTSLGDWPVQRAVVLTATIVGLLAVFSVAVGTILRHSAGAIATVIGLIIIPVLAATALPAGGGEWLMRLTPAGGLAVQRTKEPTGAIVEPWSMLSPGAGLAVVSVYTAVALLGACWLLRRRDA